MGLVKTIVFVAMLEECFSRTCLIDIFSATSAGGIALFSLKMIGQMTKFISIIGYYCCCPSRWSLSTRQLNREWLCFPPVAHDAVSRGVRPITGKLFLLRTSPVPTMGAIIEYASRFIWLVESQKTLPLVPIVFSITKHRPNNINKVRFASSGHGIYY